MDLKDLFNKSNIDIDEENIKFNEPMKNYTTFKIGGLAECLIKIKRVEDLLKIIELAKNNNIKTTIIGNGSNILVSDKGIKGIVLLNRLEGIDIKEKEATNGNIEITIESGTKMAVIAIKMLQDEITGFEELSGIPGTIGGAVVMNAGAHGKEIKDIVKSIKCLDKSGKIIELKNEELEFGYRTSILKNKEYIVLEVTLLLKKGKKDNIQEKMNEYKNYRKEKQPIEYPSAGSTFKRGNDYITAKLIDDAGLKGYKIGGAEISTKHSGFVINTGEATAKDVLELVKYIKQTIKEKFDKEIELEIEFIGER